MISPTKPWRCSMEACRLRCLPGSTPLQKRGALLAEMIGDPRIRTIPFSRESWSVVRRIFVETANKNIPIAIVYLLFAMLALGPANVAEAQSDEGAALRMPVANSSSAKERASSWPVSPQYQPVQHRLAR